MTNLDRVKHLERCAVLFRRTLTRLGYASKRQDGTLWEVRFCDALYYAPRDVGLLEVDVHRLPRKVKVLDLSRPDVLHELSTAIGGYPVEVRNRRGLVYVIHYTEPSRVELPTRVDLDLGSRPSGQYVVPLGVDTLGRHHWPSLLHLLNVLIGGEPGSGKSMMLNTWIAALTTAHPPEELRLTLVDPKRVELAGWRNLPHLVGHVATTPEETDDALDLLLDELDRRARMMQAVGARGLVSYNAVADDRLPLHLVVIDELTDLTIAAGGPRSKLFHKLIRVASTGRALGVLFVMATQSPRAEIVNGNLKAALNTRLAFRTASRADSRVILDRPDAAGISRKTPGRMVTVLSGKVVVLQGFHLGDRDLRALQPTTTVQDGEQGGLLTDEERWVASIAAYDLGGAFAIDEIYRRTGPKSEGGVSKRWLEATARRWEARGWLERDPSDPTQPRRVTQALVRALEDANRAL